MVKLSDLIKQRQNKAAGIEPEVVKEVIEEVKAEIPVMHNDDDDAEESSSDDCD
jgi:hypothetical protein